MGATSKSSSKVFLDSIFRVLFLFLVAAGTYVAYIKFGPGGASCTYNGVIYDAREVFDSEDGCNKCTCLEGNVACTMMICSNDNTGDEDAENVGEYKPDVYQGWRACQSNNLGMKVNYPEGWNCEIEHYDRDEGRNYFLTINGGNLSISFSSMIPVSTELQDDISDSGGDAVSRTVGEINVNGIAFDIVYTVPYEGLSPIFTAIEYGGDVSEKLYVSGSISNVNELSDSDMEKLGLMFDSIELI